MKFVPKTSAPPPGLDVALAPWTLKATSWILTAQIEVPPDLKDTAHTQRDALENQNNTPSVLQGLPHGAYSPFEAIHESALGKVEGQSQRRGVTASVCIIRYSATPMGPYDELLFFPNGFRNPITLDTTSRISNIFVSSESSVWNGRRNWNIPKHLARFEWEAVGPRRTLLRVYHHSDAPVSFSTAKPFFTAVLSNSRFPRVYIPPVLLGKRSRMIQPPLNVGTSPLAISTLDPGIWLSTTPKYKGRWGIGYAKPAPENKDGLPAFGDGISFPKIVLASKRGMIFKGELIFPEAEMVTNKNQK